MKKGLEFNSTNFKKRINKVIDVKPIVQKKRKQLKNTDPEKSAFEHASKILLKCVLTKCNNEMQRKELDKNASIQASNAIQKQLGSKFTPTLAKDIFNRAILWTQIKVNEKNLREIKKLTTIIKKKKSFTEQEATQFICEASLLGVKI